MAFSFVVELLEVMLGILWLVPHGLPLALAALSLLLLLMAESGLVLLLLD